MPRRKPKTTAPIHGVAVDQGSGLAAAIRTARGDAARNHDLFDFKRCVVETLSQDASMMLVDAEYGRDLLAHIGSGCQSLLAYEADVYLISKEDRITRLPDNLAVTDYPDLGVARLKFFLYYAPRSAVELNARKQDIVREIGRQCSEQGIEFLFEPLVYDETVSDAESLDFALLKPELVKAATETFADPGFGIDIMKVEVPVNLAFVEGFGDPAISRQDALQHFRDAAAAAGDIPLVYLSAGVPFDWFESSLKLAKEAGVQAAGFMCGRAIWNDGIAAFGQGGSERLTAWLASEGRARLQRLKATLG